MPEISEAVSRRGPRRIAVFFYGSFIRKEVMARGGLRPDHIEVAILHGFAIRIAPYAYISRSDEDAICGILVQATHDELAKLYSMDGIGVFLPEALNVATPDGKLQPALCYIAPESDGAPETANQEYLDRLVTAAREYGFPGWYIAHLESFRTS